jgi:hypothetical protein
LWIVILTCVETQLLSPTGNRASSAKSQPCKETRSESSWNEKENGAEDMLGTLHRVGNNPFEDDIGDEVGDEVGDISENWALSNAAHGLFEDC